MVLYQDRPAYLHLVSELSKFSHSVRSTPYWVGHTLCAEKPCVDVPRRYSTTVEGAIRIRVRVLELNSSILLINRIDR